MGVLRRVIRVGSAYYVSMPKGHLSSMGVFAGTFVVVRREGSRLIVETDPDVVKKAWEVPRCK